MHPHLDNEANAGCAEVMAAFQACHDRGFMWKAMGMCNDAKTALNLCLKAERAKRVTANRTGALDKRNKVRAMWKDIDANS
ncbi:cmc1-like, cytochrome c oxidase biogenesis protein [Niveomyces insectorum RCEF 264]|uniref:COX assembly mitochondrial protein n=1 Tax=Niveomyces insectorum RCEF 264 TaxID=1081102 RepID=A0A167VH03_9HYPO|nr:cmc1-like, cytochrome c oxidase biogenesis protein [Niveomyces insectorum RCEF 264]